MRYLKGLLCLIILSPLCVKALACNNATKIRLQKLAQNITTSYDYVESGSSVIFNITFENMNSELYLINSSNGEEYYADGELTLNNYEAGKNYKFEVRSTDVLCNTKPLSYIYVNLPFYNPYYNDAICDGISYKYCNKWQKNTLSYDEFIQNVREYRNSLIQKNEPTVQIKGIFDYIMEFYISYYFIILPLIIVISVTGIIVYIKKTSLF